MTDRLPPPNDDDIQWTKATSENGVPFEVGTKKTGRSIKRERELAMGEVGQGLMAGPGNGPGFPVHWPVGENTWKPSGIEDAVGISRYRLIQNPGSIWSYRLDFTNVWGWAFTFLDESGDFYKVRTLHNGNHYFRYNSYAPTIKYVW